MKPRTRFPADLLALFLLPIFALGTISVVTDCAMWLFNWLAAHH